MLILMTGLVNTTDFTSVPQRLLRVQLIARPLEYNFEICTSGSAYLLHERE